MYGSDVTVQTKVWGELGTAWIQEPAALFRTGLSVKGYTTYFPEAPLNEISPVPPPLIFQTPENRTETGVARLADIKYSY